jgi:hypothetical protein
MRKHDLGQRRAGFHEDGLADHLQWLQPPAEEFELLSRQCLQQLIGRTLN